MNRILLIFLVFVIAFVGCKKTEKPINKLEIAEKYFEALNKSDGVKMKTLLADSIVTVIPKYEYELAFSKNDYTEKWLKWDAVFEPTYKVLAMELENGTVKVKVSKVDKRILFFMQKPFITNEILRFSNGKIIAAETEYLNFNETIWEQNKTELLAWTEENYPELNLSHFIYDQTKFGGKKLLKAMELYKNKE